MLQSFLCVLISLWLFAAQQPRPSGTLAYVSAGNMWVKALPDGVSRQVSQGGGAGFPEWSPSGQWLAFRQGERLERLILLSMSGERREIAAADSAWSPQGDELAFIDEAGLCVMRLDGIERQKRMILPHSPSLRVSVPKWSPDGRTLAISAETPGPAGRPELRAGHLWRINSDGSQAREIFTPAERGGVAPAGWSSDGQRILVRFDPHFSASLAADGLPLIAVPAAGGPARELVSQVLVHADFMAVSPLNPKILMVSGGKRDAWTNKRLVSVDMATGESRALTDNMSAIGSAAWSPAGDRIAYVSGPDAPNAGGGDAAKKALAGRKIQIMMADGQQSRRLTSDPQYRDEYPRWSPDGRHIVFIRVNEQGNAAVWSISTDTGASARIVDDVGATGPDSWFGYYGHIDWYQYAALSPK